jgi:hypothetical protein
LHEGYKDKEAIAALDELSSKLTGAAASEPTHRDRLCRFYYLKGACLRRLGAAQVKRLTFVCVTTMPMFFRVRGSLLALKSFSEARSEVCTDLLFDGPFFFFFFFFSTIV